MAAKRPDHLRRIKATDIMVLACRDSSRAIGTARALRSSDQLGLEKWWQQSPILSSSHFAYWDALANAESSWSIESLVAAASWGFALASSAQTMQLYNT